MLIASVIQVAQEESRPQALTMLLGIDAVKPPARLTRAAATAKGHKALHVVLVYCSIHTFSPSCGLSCGVFSRRPAGCVGYRLYATSKPSHMASLD